MRIYIKLSKNKEIIPLDYQHLLTGVIHKWIGIDNDVHGTLSFFSFSWLQNTSKTSKGYQLTDRSFFFISAYDDSLIKNIVNGILNNPGTFCGSFVSEIQLMKSPSFSTKERFFLNSPILLKRKDGIRQKHITYKDEEFGLTLTESLKNKLKLANLDYNGVEVELDCDYVSPKTKLVDYKGIKNKTTLAPVIIKGTPEQISFAWEVGLGNSTGIGFGSLK